MIQTQVSIVHLESGLNMASGIQRATQEPTFTSGVINVGTAEESIVLGDIIVPKQVFLKLIAGDSVKIGFVPGEYPLALTVPLEAMALSLNVESTSFERSVINTIGDVNKSLEGRYFDIWDVDGPVRVWFGLPLSAAATGQIQYNTPQEGDTVTVDGHTFTFSATPGANIFSSITELNALVNGLSTVNSTNDSFSINVVAATPGEAGNSIQMSVGSGNSGDMTVDSPLTGGATPTPTPANPEGGRSIGIDYTVNDTADTIASLINSRFNSDGAFSSTVSGNVVTATDLQPEARPPIDKATSGFEVSRSTIVSSHPTVYVKSLGAAQLAIAIAPL